MIVCIGNIVGYIVASVASTSFGSTPLSLLSRVKASDRQAWFAFCDLYGPLVYYWCRTSGLSHDETEDLAQQVFGRLAVSIVRFEKQEVGHRFRAWLWTLTRHLIQDFHRAQRRRIKTVGGEAGSQFIARQSDKNQGEDHLPEEADVVTPPTESRQLFLRMLDQIRDRHSERNWQAFWRVVVDGNLTLDVARDLNMTPNHVRQAKSRILRQLRQEFGELLD